MIDVSRSNHILGVARKSKVLALKLNPNNKKYAEDMFLLGILHDIGYEFTKNHEDHSRIGGEILKRANYNYWEEVSLHGDDCVENMSDELFLLNYADMTTGTNGEDVSFKERLDEIANRFGAKSSAYKKCVKVIERLKLDTRSDSIK